MKILLVSLCFALLLCSCATPRAESHSGRLSEAQVLKMADAFAKLKRPQHDPFDLRFYAGRSARFDPQADVWRVYYSRKPIRYLGDHFGIRVDDATGEMQYFGGR
ncbi:MAG: hypothetical protein E4H02_05390 [Lentisphaerales bacterium]|jgi:hypothetical protein|nr:MAG: hypothetical protein E4H02_05390 [Lentisphaerales bacterium]